MLRCLSTRCVCSRALWACTPERLSNHREAAGAPLLLAVNAWQMRAWSAAVWLRRARVVMRGRACTSALVSAVQVIDLRPHWPSQIVRQEALISDARKPQLRKLIYKLIEKQVRTRAGYRACLRRVEWLL